MRPARVHGARSQSGSVLIALVVAIAAAIAFTAVLAKKTSFLDYRLYSVADQVPKQANMIRQRVLECVNIYSGWPSPAGGIVRTLVCPNAPASLQPLWNSAEGRFLPGPIQGFTEWTYNDNGTTSSISITAPVSSSVTQGLAKALQGYTSTEAGCSISGSNVTFTLWLRFPNGTPPANLAYPLCG